MVSARREGDTVIVFIPGWMSESEETRWVDEMVRRLERSEARRRSPARTGDDALRRRSIELSRRYLEGRAEPTTVRWVPTMSTRWASCTPADGTIRVSERLRDAPGWVVDYETIFRTLDMRSRSKKAARHNLGEQQRRLKNIMVANRVSDAVATCTSSGQYTASRSSGVVGPQPSPASSQHIAFASSTRHVLSSVASARVLSAASNSSSFHCSKLKPFGEKFADEK